MVKNFVKRLTTFLVGITTATRKPDIGPFTVNIKRPAIHSFYNKQNHFFFFYQFVSLAEYNLPVNAEKWAEFLLGVGTNHRIPFRTSYKLSVTV